jgi:hypothetical protein
MLQLLLYTCMAPVVEPAVAAVVVMAACLIPAVVVAAAAVRIHRLLLMLHPGQYSVILLVPVAVVEVTAAMVTGAAMAAQAEILRLVALLTVGPPSTYLQAVVPMAAVDLVRATARAVAEPAAQQVVVQPTIRVETAMPVAVAMVALVETALVRQEAPVDHLLITPAVPMAVAALVVETALAETAQPVA